MLSQVLRAAFLFISAFLSGCGLTALTSEVSVQDNGVRDDGVVYNLPKTNLQVTITETYLPQGTDVITKAQFFVWCFPPSSPPPPDGGWKQLICNPDGDIAASGNTLTYPSKLLPKRQVKWASADLSQNPGVFGAVFKEEHVSYDFAVTPQDRPDLDQRYVLKYQHNALFNDRLCIGRTPTGLLSVVEYAGDDRTQEVLFNLVRTFTAFTRAPQAADTANSASGINRASLTRQIVRVVDPWRVEWNGQKLVHSDLASLSKEAERGFGGSHLTVDLKDGADSIWSILEGSLRQYCGSNRACVEDKLRRVSERRCDPGTICYRTKIKVPVLLRDDRGIVIKSADVDMVNSYDLGSIAVERAFLVEKITKLYFQNGSLTGMALRKPSEAQSASLLPINVITAALSTPVGLFSTAFSGDTATKVQLANDLGQLKGKVDTLNSFQAAGVGRIGTSSEDTFFQVQCVKGTNTSLIPQ